MYNYDEILEAQERTLKHFEDSPYYTPDNVQMYKVVLNVMNANLPKPTREDSLVREQENRMYDEPAEPMADPRIAELEAELEEWKMAATAEAGLVDEKRLANVHLSIVKNTILLDIDGRPDTNFGFGCNLDQVMDRVREVRKQQNASYAPKCTCGVKTMQPEFHGFQCPVRSVLGLDKQRPV